MEELGIVRQIVRGVHSVRLTVGCHMVRQDLKIGDSVAVNGACLTVVQVGENEFTADIMPETVDRTALIRLRLGEKVNLERAVRLGDRLGGHLVTGHIDGIGYIRRKVRDDNAVRLAIEASQDVLRLVVLKGSIAVDGISLTVAELGSDYFGVSLIPHTAAVTTLGYKQVGDQVNLETDIVGKYVARLLEVAGAVKGEHRLDKEFLHRYGFV